MSFESDLYAALIGTAALTALVGERIVPSHEKVQPAAPFVIYTTVFDDKRYDLDGATGMSKVRLQVDCYADDQDEAMAIADAVIAAIPVTGFPLHRTQHNEQDLGLEPGTQLYRRMLEFSIFHRT